MRRLPFGGTGLLVIAAAALPILIKSSKPLAKKIGEAMEKFGQKLKESSEVETPNKRKEAERPEPKIPDAPEPESATKAAPKAAATKVRQTKPTTQAAAKPRPKKTVKSTPSKPKTTAKKPETPES